MKTTLEIPDLVFRRAKSVAAARGIPLREFVTEAVAIRLVIAQDINLLSSNRPYTQPGEEYAFVAP